MTDKLIKGSRFIRKVVMYEALCNVSAYAYCKNCSGLTKKDCETLEVLCDTAADALAREVAEVITHE